MAKGLPVIQNFDALLLLLNEPEKVRGYLNEIKAYRDEIKQALDITQTVDQARRVAQDAVNKRAAAEQFDIDTRDAAAADAAKVRAATTAMYDQAAALKLTLQIREDVLQSEQAKFEAWRVSVESDITGQRAELSAKEQDLTSREAAVSIREREAVELRSKLDTAFAALSQ